MEAFELRMTRRSFVFAMLMLLLTAVLCAATAEEKISTAVSTPTDLSCLHEHLRTTTYFFDGPAYTSVSSASHRVSGPATIEVVCLDCGEVISSETVGMAEEIRPHSMKKGVCVLCGFRSKARAAELQRQPEDLPGERTIYAQADEQSDGLLTLTLSGADLTALERANVTTALIRGETGIAAIALKVPEIRAQTEKTGANLYIELEERDDGSFFVGLFLVGEPGEKSEPEDQGISLRFYQETRADVRISLVPADDEELVETEGVVWDEHGYWSVPYLEEGTYFLLK